MFCSLRLVLCVLLTKLCVCRRLLHAMHQAKVEEAVQQAKALRKAMETGKLAQTVSACSYTTLITLEYLLCLALRVESLPRMKKKYKNHCHKK